MVKLMDKLVLILPFVAVIRCIVLELLLHVVIMAFFAGADVSFSVWKQVIGTEREEVELADVRIIKVVTFGQSNE